MQLTTLGFTPSYEVGLPKSSSVIVTHEFLKPNTMTPSTEMNLQTAVQAVTLEVTPDDGEPWLGKFWSGAEGLDGVFATPNPDVLCVVVKGQAYWIPVHQPKAFEVVRSIPIKQVLSNHTPPVLLFVSYTRLSAYGPQGFMWMTDDLSWDGLKILDIRAGIIRGNGWDSPANCDKPFSVDLVTGQAEGGSSPAKYGVFPEHKNRQLDY